MCGVSQASHSPWGTSDCPGKRSRAEHKWRCWLTLYLISSTSASWQKCWVSIERCLKPLRRSRAVLSGTPHHWMVETYYRLLLSETDNAKLTGSPLFGQADGWPDYTVLFIGFHSLKYTSILFLKDWRYAFLTRLYDPLEGIGAMSSFPTGQMR